MYAFERSVSFPRNPASLPSVGCMPSTCTSFEKGRDRGWLTEAARLQGEARYTRISPG